jgi:hypothetical protein
MLHVEIDEENLIAILRPEGALSADDFGHAAAIIDPYIEQAGGLKGLVIYTREFPGWDSFAGFLAHLRFVRDHHRRIGAVALVTDSPLGDFAEDVAGHFIDAEVEEFDFDELDKARGWILDRDDD